MARLANRVASSIVLAALSMILPGCAGHRAETTTAAGLIGVEFPPAPADVEIDLASVGAIAGPDGTLRSFGLAGANGESFVFIGVPSRNDPVPPYIGRVRIVHAIRLPRLMADQYVNIHTCREVDGIRAYSQVVGILRSRETGVRLVPDSAWRIELDGVRIAAIPSESVSCRLEAVRDSDLRAVHAPSARRGKQ